MLRTARRLSSSSLRSSARANLNAAPRSPRAALTWRMMSSESHASHGSTSSDTPWIIGSALVFGPLFLYLVSPSAHKGSHGHADHAHNQSHRDRHAQHDESHRREDVGPIADDEGTEISGQEVKESMENAFGSDSPKDAQQREEVVTKATVADNSATEAHPNAGSSIDTTPITESEPNATPVAPVETNEAIDVTSDEKVQSSPSGTGEPATESGA